MGLAEVRKSGASGWTNRIAPLVTSLVDILANLHGSDWLIYGPDAPLAPLPGYWAVLVSRSTKKTQPGCASRDTIITRCLKKWQHAHNTDTHKHEQNWHRQKLITRDFYHLATCLPRDRIHLETQLTLDDGWKFWSEMLDRRWSLSPLNTLSNFQPCRI